MDVKDLAGIKKPLTKLIDTIAKGIGAASEPYLIKARADAKAYEIRVISEAIRESKEALDTIEVKDGNVLVSASRENIDAPSTLPVEARAQRRLSFQEEKRQQNVENVTANAAAEIVQEQEISEAEVDEDWIARFFRLAEDISSESMQYLWGKILAGEVAKPGRYSLRTLDLLKNLSQEDAELFVKVSQAVIRFHNDLFILKGRGEELLKEHFDVSFKHVLKLQELGLLVPQDLTFSIKVNEEEATSGFITGNRCLIVKRAKGADARNLLILKLTGVGEELFNLVEVSGNDEYLKTLAEQIKCPGSEAHLADVLELHQDGFRYDNAVEIFNVPKEGGA